MKLYIGTDHRGVELERRLIDYFSNHGYEVIDSKVEHNDSDDYPDFAFDVCENVIKNPDSLGILLCGTGIGMSIAANKVKGIRAARCVTDSDAYFARIHNNANVICLGINDNTFEKLCSMINTFLKEYGEVEERHQKRVSKIINYEERA